MRKMIVAVLAFNAGLLAVRVAQEAGVVEAGAARLTTIPGDANGDSFLDITDPVYLLEHLFLGGPPPVAQAGSSDLDARMAALEELLVGVSREQLDDGQGGSNETLRISGANLQIVNGEGSTGTVNGTGNLIVGYNRPVSGGESNRTGSHVIVCGDQNNYSSWGGFVSGTKNTITERFSNVLGGRERPVPEEFGRVGAIPLEQEDALSHFSVVHLPKGPDSIDVSVPCSTDTVETAKTIRITGANLQLVNGVIPEDRVGQYCGYSRDPEHYVPHGWGNDSNGLGNLFLGYVGYFGEGRSGQGREGSHNIIMGEGEDWSGLHQGKIIQGDDPRSASNRLRSTHVFGWFSTFFWDEEEEDNTAWSMVDVLGLLKPTWE